MTKRQPEDPDLVDGVFRVSVELWWAWAEVAGEQERSAAHWRGEGRDALLAGKNPSSAIAQENKACMASFVAAGAALETLGRSIAQFRTATTSKKGAANHLFAQVTAVFPEADLSESLRARVQDVFRYRNLTVHYSATFEEMGPHPLGIDTTWVARTFTVEAARECVDTIADLLAAMTHPGTSPEQEAEWWASRNRYVGKQLRGRVLGMLPLDLVP